MKESCKMTKTTLLALALSVCALSASAVEWKNLDDAHYIAGPKLTETQLRGKVVLIDCWGVNCPPCRALLPHMQNLWKTYRSRPFVLIGSHRQLRDDARLQELVENNKLTYANYQGFGLAEGEPSFNSIPFLMVIDHRGKLVYSGHSEPEATEALVEALMEAGSRTALYGDVKLDKFKSLENDLVWGKNVKMAMMKLVADVKRGRTKQAGDDARNRASEAEAILKAMAESKRNEKAEIEELKESNPEEAVKRIRTFVATFPDDAAAYRADLVSLAKKVREQSARQKPSKK